MPPAPPAALMSTARPSEFAQIGAAFAIRAVPQVHTAARRGYRERSRPETSRHGLDQCRIIDVHHGQAGKPGEHADIGRGKRSANLRSAAGPGGNRQRSHLWNRLAAVERDHGEPVRVQIQGGCSGRARRSRCAPMMNILRRPFSSRILCKRCCFDVSGPPLSFGGPVCRVPPSPGSSSGGSSGGGSCWRSRSAASISAISASRIASSSASSSSVRRSRARP